MPRPGDELPIEEKIKAVSQVITKGVDIGKSEDAVALGFLIGLLTSLHHPEWAAGVRHWMVTKNPPRNDTLSDLGSIYVENIPIENLNE